ncbi:hypothetical protein SG34_030975 [Thalassomonas viridans]|uniref:Uncharacterized protein n=1 Tax=Thalassomonas viridans TaxID=137584 RepID=A0AAE9Z9F4_9GAMM|nr:hypothetical protein [Thalassomonas viridans]WDE09190.1 hypothetical protein SG34_030975 [Thalassomonas viridans]
MDVQQSAVSSGYESGVSTDCRSLPALFPHVKTGISNLAPAIGHRQAYFRQLPASLSPDIALPATMIPGPLPGRKLLVMENKGVPGIARLHRNKGLMSGREPHQAAGSRKISKNHLKNQLIITVSRYGGDVVKQPLAGMYKEKS